MTSAGGNREAGFAKLQGEDFEYFMQTYSIILGRNRKKEKVDLDISVLGGGTDVSRRHARIFYDFERRRFSLEVLSKKGCYVEGVLHFPGDGPVKLDSQDLLQIGQKKFYFLLPTRSIFATAAIQRAHIATAAGQHTRIDTTANQDAHIATAAGQDAHTVAAADQHAHIATAAGQDARTATAAGQDAPTATAAGQDAHTATAAAKHADTATTA
ncbi:hypothetical protein ABZP36_034962 [Zizania latifolia]